MATSPNSALHEALMLYREMSGGVEVVSDHVARRCSLKRASTTCAGVSVW